MTHTTNDAPVTVEQDPYLATIEEFEHEDQRELCRLYNHRPDDSLQFSRSNMREAIRHGRRLAALASAPAGDGVEAPIRNLAFEIVRESLTPQHDRNKAASEPEGYREKMREFVDLVAPKAAERGAAAYVSIHAESDAALASAPAGDGVKSERWRERWYGSAPQKGSAITDERGNLIAYFGGDESTHAAVTKIVLAHNAALARPRAAVEDPEQK